MHLKKTSARHVVNFINYAITIREQGLGKRIAMN
jgi:hypothetical protein